MTNSTSQIAKDMLIGGIKSAIDLAAPIIGGAISPGLQVLISRANTTENPMNIHGFISALDDSLNKYIENSDSEFLTKNFNVSSAAQAVACDLLHQSAFDSKAYLTEHGEDPEKATNSLLRERAQYLPSPCEDVLMARIRILVTAWFDAMRSQPIVLSDISRNFRQEVLDGQAEQLISTNALRKSVSEIQDDIPEHFERQSRQHADTQNMLSQMLSAVEKISTNQANGVQTKPSEEENTALHGQLTQIALNIENGEINNSIAQLETLRTSVWASASPTEKRRLHAIKANAYFAKGDLESVQSNLSNAIVACPDHKLANEDRALLSLLEDDYKSAEELALTALMHDTSSLNAACILISSRRDRTDIDLAESIPEELLQNPRVQGTKLWVQWGRQECGWEENALRSWHECSPEEKTVYPLDLVYALAVVELACKTEMSVAFGSTIENISRAELEQASEILVKNAKDALSCDSQTFPESVNNAVTSLRLLGNDDATELAKSLLDSSLVLRSDVESLYLHRSILALVDGESQWIVDNISDDIGSSELLTHRVHSLIQLSRLTEATSTIKRIQCPPDDVTANCFLLDLKFQLAIGLSDDSAIETVLTDIDSMIDLHPSELRYQLLKCRVYRTLGRDKEAISILLLLLPLYRTDTDFSIRMQGAIEAESFERHDLIVDLLWDRVAKEIDSQPLQMLIVALLNNHDYSLASKLIEELSEKLTEEPFYLKSVARLSMCVGDNNALLHAEAYLEKVPNDAEVLTYKIHRLQMQGDQETVRNTLNSIDLGSLEGPILNQMQLCNAVVTYGNVRLGFDALFQLLLNNWNDHRLHQTYQALAYTNSDTSSIFSASDKVCHMSSVTILDPNNIEKVQIIWDCPPPILLADSVRQDSELGRLLIGKSVGEKFTIGSGFGQIVSTVGKIESVYYDVLRRSEADFRTRFPTIEGNLSISVNTNEEGLSEDFIEIIKAQTEGTERALKLYQSNRYPLTLLAQALSTSVLEARVTLIQHGISFPCSTGILSERRAAIRAIKNNNSKGCVCDLLTAILIHKLDIWNEVLHICGELHICSRDVDTLSLRIMELERFKDEPRMSIGYSNGGLICHELSKQEVRAIYNQRQLEFDFISGACKQVSAMPTVSMSAMLKKFKDIKEDRIGRCQDS